MKKLEQAFMDTDLLIPIPHIAAVILSCAAGAAQVLNQTQLAVSASWHAYIGLGLVIVTYLGVKPLVGAEFRDALHLPAALTQTITGLVGAATVVTGQLPVPVAVQPALAAAFTVLIGLGFGPAGSSIAAPAARRRALKRHREALALEKASAR